MGDHRIGGYAFTFQPSHRPPNKVRVVPLDSEGGYKGRSTYLLEKFSPTYSHRAGYTLSPAAALKLLAAMAQGGEYVSPKEARAKVAAEKSKRDVIAFVLSKGGRVVGRADYPQVAIDTPYGELVVTPDDPGTVFTRFSDSDRAKHLGGYSGKWNFHGDDAVGSFKLALSQLLARQNPRKRGAPRRNPMPSKAELDALIHAYARLKHFRRGYARFAGHAGVEQKLYRSYEKALAKVLRKIGDTALSSENQRGIDEQADAWWASKGMRGPGVDW